MTARWQAALGYALTGEVLDGSFSLFDGRIAVLYGMTEAPWSCYLPAAQMAALRQAVSKAVQDPEYKHNVAARGVENLYVAPERLDAFFVSETKKWRDTALSIGIKPE